MFETIVPPHDEEMEKSLLGSLLADPEQFSVVDSVINSNPEVFYRIKNKTIYESMQNLIVEYDTFDLPLLYSKVKEKTDEVPASYLSEITLPTGYLAEQYAVNLVELYNKRLAILECQNTVVELTSGSDFTTTISSLRGRLDASILNPAFKFSTNIADDALKFWEDYLDNEKERHNNLIFSGWSVLDNMVTVKKSHHIIVGARTSMGKTSFALSWATSVALQGKRVLFFTMEQSKESLTECYISQLADVPRDHFMKGILTPEDRQKVANTAKTWGSNKLMGLGVYEGTYSAQEIRHKIILELEKKPVDIIYIDFLHAMKPPTGYKRDGHEWLREATKQLEEIAIELNVTIVTMAQLSREVDKRDNKRPVQTDIREAGEDHADTILFIYRDEYYDPETDDPGIAEIIVSKQRHGPTGTVRLAFIDYSTRFEDVHNARDYLDERRGSIESWSASY